MKSTISTVFSQNKDIVTVVLVTSIVLMLPLIGMQISTDVDWGVIDFAIMGTLLLGTGLTFVLITRKIKNTKHRIILGICLLLAFLYVWAELAVGIFTNLGS